MPSRQRNESNRIIVSSDDEDRRPQSRRGSQGRPSSQNAAGFTTLSADQQEELTIRFYRYMLARHSRKRPVKRNELTKHLFHNMGNIKSKQRIFSAVYQRAQAKLRLHLGVQVVEIKRRVRRATQSSRSAVSMASSSQGPSMQKAYILVTALQSGVRVEDTERLGEIGFLTVIASMIVLTPGCRIDEDDLYRNLERIGVTVRETGGHKQLNNGNVKDLLEKEFIEQWYLEKEKEGNSTYYMLGARFFAEMKDEHLIDFVEAVYQLGNDESSTLDETARQDLLHRLADARGDFEDDDDDDNDEA